MALDCPSSASALDAGHRAAAQAGFSSRSGWLTSPTFGGGSWLAHSTLQSGLWVDNQQRYDRAPHLDRLTLTAASARGWRTLRSPRRSRRTGRRERPTTTTTRSTTPGTSGTPGRGSAGRRCPTSSPSPRSSGSSSRQADRPPIMAEVSLVSSHWPWTPIPRLVDWDRSATARSSTPWRSRPTLRGASGGHAPAQGRLRPVHRLLAGRPDLLGSAPAGPESGPGRARRPPAVHARLRRGGQPRRPHQHHRSGPGCHRADRELGLAGGAAAGRRRTGVADGRLPGQVPHRLRHRIHGPAEAVPGAPAPDQAAAP